MGVTAVLSLVQSALGAYNYPVEIQELAKSVGMSLPTMFFSAFMAEWLWKDGEGWTLFQRVFYRILVFTLMMMVIRTAMDYVWLELLSESGSFRIFEHFIYSFHYAALSGCLYFVIRLLLVSENPPNQKGNKFDSEVIDR
jgi:hypothetical protein